VDLFREPLKDGRVNVWILFRYAKSAITKEKQRLVHLKSSNEEIRFSEQGDSKNTGEGVLEVVSQPPGAEVLIDGDRWGRTPLRIYGQLQVGKHQIRLDHPRFEAVEEPLIVVPGNTLRIEKILVRATGGLRVITSPPNASVFLDGKPMGGSPTEAVPVEAGKKMRLVISHADAEKMSQEVEVGKGEVRELNLSLPLKPAYLSIVTVPSGAEVHVNGKAFGKDGRSPSSMTRIDPGRHTLQISKDGYRTQTLDVELHGGQRRTLSSIQLVSLSDVERQEQENQMQMTASRERKYLSPWQVGVGAGVSTSSLSGKKSYFYQVEVVFQKWFQRRLGLRVSGAYTFGGSSGKSETVLVNGSVTNVGNFTSDSTFPYHIGGWIADSALLLNLLPENEPSLLYVSLDGGYLSQKYKGLSTFDATTGLTQHQGFDVNQVRFGGSVGYEFLPRDQSWAVDARVGVKKHSDAGNEKGAVIFFVGLGTLFSF
jgi:hypothetical protein